MLRFTEATKDYLVHRGLTTHDVEKRGRKGRYKAIRTCLLFSREVRNIERSILVLSSPTRVGLVDPPSYSKTITWSVRRFNGSLLQLARLAGSFFWIETIDPRVLQNVKILTTFRLAIACPDLVQQIAHFQAGAGSTAAILLRRVVLRARAQRRFAAVFPRPFPKHFSGPLGIL